MGESIKMLSSGRIINLIFEINMKNTVEKFYELVEAFKKDAEAQIEKSNKAAGVRARKVSLEIEKLMKEFRKQSLEDSKK